MRRLRELFRLWFYGPANPSDLDRELQDHLDLEAVLQMDKGRSRDEAQRLAHRDLGNTAQIKEAVYESTWAGVLDGWSKELRHALRSLGRQPAFTVTAVLSLALGIGANAAIFTVGDQALLRLLPVQKPKDLAAFHWKGRFIAGSTRGGNSAFSYPAFREL